MKHYGIIMIALVLLICTSAFAEISSISAPKVRAEADKFVVPIELNNTVPLAAMDIPFKFSEGVTLEEVTFEGTRSEGFDFKWANIDNVCRLDAHLLSGNGLEIVIRESYSKLTAKIARFIQ